MKRMCQKEDLLLPFPGWEPASYPLLLPLCPCIPIACFSQWEHFPLAPTWHCLFPSFFEAVITPYKLFVMSGFNRTCVPFHPSFPQYFGEQPQVTAGNTNTRLGIQGISSRASFFPYSAFFTSLCLYSSWQNSSSGINLHVTKPHKWFPNFMCITAWHSFLKDNQLKVQYSISLIL